MCILTHCHGHCQRVYTEITECKSTELCYMFGNVLDFKRDVQNFGGWVSSL